MKPIHSATLCWILAAALPACQQRPVDLAPSSVQVEWERVHTFEESADARVIWANGPSDIYVGYDYVPTGQTSALLHYDGSIWTSIELPPSDSDYIRDLWAPGSGELYVSARSLWRRDGNSWSLMPVPAGPVAGTSSSDVYVGSFYGGSGNYVTHFNGASWDTLLATSQFVRSIYAFPGPELVVARNDSVLRWNGSTWSSELAVGGIDDMWGVASTDLYAVGSDRFDPGRGAAWHWNGTSWISQAVPSGVRWLDAVSGSGSGEVIATSDYGNAMLRLEGGAWNRLQLPTSRSFSDVAFTGPDEWVAAGEQDKVIRRTGAVWSTLRDGGPHSAGVVWMDSRDFVVAAENELGGNNSIYRFEGGAWQEEPQRLSAPTAMHGSSRDNIYMTTYDRSVFHFDGSTWSTAVDSLTMDQRDVSVAPDGGVFTVGQESSYRYDGSAWESTYSGSRILQRVWARSRDEAYAITGEALMKFAGGSWRVVHEDSHELYRDVWGTNSGEVYVVSTSGVHRYHDGTFQRVSPPGWGGEFISGTSSTDILTGSDLFFYVFDGVLWEYSRNSYAGYIAQLDPYADGNLFLLLRLSNPILDSDALFIRRR